jgi:(1->4)-alpha-D-glucan 1-alpha-D-glucosylmutase
MLKAVREAKEYTSWANTNSDYEAALSSFVRGILKRTNKNRFLHDFENFQHRVAQTAAFNSLSQALLKLTSPGVPDIYQGNELLHFALVDPDNRQPVDYDFRTNKLHELQQALSRREFSSELSRNPETNSAKLYLTWKALNIRKQYSGLFQRGDYIPLVVTGEKSSHVVAFGRNFEGQSSIIAVPRLCAKLIGDSHQSVCDPALWNNTNIELPDSHPSCYHNVLTGECIPVVRGEVQGLPLGNLFQYFPVALLVGEASGSDASACK